MGVSGCLLAYLGVTLGGDSVNPKPESLNHFMKREGSHAGILGRLETWV